MPFKDAFMSWLASRADEELQATMPNEAASTVEDSVTREMEPAMDISITMNIGPSLAEILPDMINDIVADKTASMQHIGSQMRPFHRCRICLVYPQ